MELEHEYQSEGLVLRNIKYSIVDSQKHDEANPWRSISRDKSGIPKLGAKTTTDVSYHESPW